ncbi:MAG: M28 family peptidase [Fimbriimonadaceae bacterium]|nr:M28 family peptidase [Fimbriimonadaceae bacterium]
MARSVTLAALALASAFAHAQYSGAVAPPDDLKGGWDTITVSSARTWMNYLAGPETQGRGTGQAGYQKAADFMAAKFKEFGCLPASKDGTYFQNVPFQRATADKSSFFEVGKVKVSVGQGFGFGNPTGSGEAEGGIVFVSMKGDVELADPSVLKGKFVVLMSGGQPGRKFRRQMFDQDARLVRVADKVPASSEGVRRKSANEPPQGPGRTLSTGVLELSKAKQIAAAAGVNPTMLNVAGAEGIVVQPGSGTAKMVASVKWEDVGVPNVVAMIEGSDPTLKAEVVGLGAHLDHLGVSGDTVYPGADDDASGNTSLLLVAQAMAKNPVKPKRTVLFMAFCGEEMGLIGSGYYANNPIFPLDKMTCELQMDMVGRNEETKDEKASDNVDTLHLVGSKRISTELHNAVLEANKHVNFKFEYDEEDVYTRSDHYQFASKGVPIAFLFSGFHPDYHQPTDTLDKINFDKIANAARLFYLVGMDAANRPAMFKREVTEKGSTR